MLARERWTTVAQSTHPPSLGRDAVAGIQWLLFMFANTVVIPVSVGAALHLSPVAVSGFMQRSFLFTGLACLLQLLFGHRLPLMEGQSGVWWGVILTVLTGAAEAGQPLSQAGGSLEMGILASGILIMIFGVMGLGRFLRKYFTPMAMSVFLILLAVQLISIFFQGMVGLTHARHIDVKTTALSIALIILVVTLSLRGARLLSNFAILIGIASGWVVYRIAIHPSAPLHAAPFASLFTPFAWGSPSFHAGILITALITGLINTTNTVTTIENAQFLFHQKSTNRDYVRSFLVTGFNTVLSGLIGLVPYAPYTSSLGFLRSTQIFARRPFAIGAILFMLLGLIPLAGSFLSTLPVSVGDAVLLVAYLQLFGSALQVIEGVTFNHKTIYRIALPTLVGIAIYVTPASAFLTIPSAVRSFVSSGLLVGVAVSVILENTIKWNRAEIPSA